MLIVYEKHERSLVARMNQANWFAIDFFHQGIVDKVVVKQVGGDDTPYVVRLYNSRRPLPPDSLSSGAQDQDGEDPQGYYAGSPELYLVADPYHMQAGETLIDRTSRSFKNMDGVPQGVPIIPERFIYVVIEPEFPGITDGDSTWDVAIGGHYFDS